EPRVLLVFIADEPKAVQASQGQLGKDMLIDRSLDEERLPEPALRDHAGLSVRQREPVDRDSPPRAEKLDAIDPHLSRRDRVPGSDNSMVEGIAWNGNAFLSGPSPRVTSIAGTDDLPVLDLDSLVADLERALTVRDH